ncbi:hypothetical protein ABNC76_17595 [Paenibacillus larvae]
MKIKNWILCITVAITLIGESSAFSTTTQATVSNATIALSDHGVGGDYAS